MPSFVKHLESAIDPSTTFPVSSVQTVHENRPLLVRYDLDAVRKAVTPAEWATRPASMWRYRELLPYESDDAPMTLGEVQTPLVHVPSLGNHLGGLANLFVKDESYLPTGSFKARGLAMAVTRAKELGMTRLAIPTAGNAGGALAAYAARAGIEAFVFMPSDTPVINQLEAQYYGAQVFLVEGLIGDCGKVAREGVERMNWFDCSTLREPYRIEGKKTMGLEIAEQFNYELPDVIIYPTGGGTGLIGMWKAFNELRELGWLRSPDSLPRMFACQSEGCAPIVRAFENGDRFADPYPNPQTVATGLRVPAAIGDFLILNAVRRSGGEARSASDSKLTQWMQTAGALEGVSLCPESAACLEVLSQLVREQRVRADERIIVFNTASAHKYVEAMRSAIGQAMPPVPRTSVGEVDWDALSRMAE